MKDNVDKRVVQFEFDNSKFDKNVKNSIKTLDKLDESLQFKDVSKSLDQIKMKFTALEVASASFIMNITNRVTNLGINLVKSLSIDNISAGWQKFGEKTISVGTLMSQTLKIAGREITDYSEKINIVNEQLDRLNWFTDETSYNFTDMVDNIGKFTAAGQNLDTSVEAMMGIANWAALSGQNAATASRAMYQLSQALGKGYVQLIDYKSIQNANMDTQEFRQTVLDTAVAMGELTKQGENYITKAGKKFTKNQFTEELASKWFTSGVLTKSLEKYSSAVDKLYEITEKEGITASEAIEKYADQFDEFALKAFKAAQEARTFSDAINSVKDAVSTGWMNTAETVFGGYEEAKTLWTDLANELYDVFAESGNFRNEVLGVWKELEGRSTLFSHTGKNDQGAFWNIYDSIQYLKKAISDAWDTIFPKTVFSSTSDKAKELGYQLKETTSRWQELTNKVRVFLKENENIKNVFSGLFSILRFGVSILQNIKYILDPILYTIKEMLNTLLEFGSEIGETLSNSSKISEFILKVSTKLHDILTDIMTIINPNSILKSILNILKSIANVFNQLFDGISKGLENVLGYIPDLDSFGDLIVDGASKITELLNSLMNFFSRKIIPIIGKGLKFIGEVIGNIVGYIKVLVSYVGKAIESISDFFKNNINLTKSIEKIGNALESFTEKIKDFFDTYTKKIKSVPKSKDSNEMLLTLNVSETKDNAKKAKKNIEEQISILDILKDLLNSFINILKSVAILATASLKLISGLLNTVNKYILDLATLFDGVSKGLEESKAKLKELLIISGITLIVVELIKAIVNFKWMLEFAEANVIGVLDEAAYALTKLSKSQIWKGIADALRSLGYSMLMITSSLLILKQVPLDAFLKGGLILAALIAGIVILASKAKTLQSAISRKVIPSAKGLAGKTKTLEGLFDYTTIREISEFLASMSIAMLTIALSFKIIGNISTDDIWKGAGLLLVLGVVIGAMAAIGALTKKSSNGIRSSIPGLLQCIGMALALKAFAKSLEILFNLQILKDANALKKICNTVIISLGIIAGTFAVVTLLSRLIASKTGAVAKQGITMNLGLSKIAQILTSTSFLLLSLVASIKILETVKMGFWPALGVFAGLTSFVIAILVASKYLLKAMGDSKKQDKEIGILSKMQRNPVSQILDSVALILLSVASSIAILSNLQKSKEGIKAMWSSFGLLMSIIVVIGALSIALSIFMKDTTKLDKLEGNKRASATEKSIVTTSNSISKILNSIALLLGVFAVSVSILSMIPDQSAVTKISISIMIFITAIMGIIVGIVAVSKKTKAGGQVNSMLPTLISLIVGIATLITAFAVLADIDFLKMLKVTGFLTLFLGSLVICSNAIRKAGKSALVSNKTILTSIVPLLTSLILLTASIKILENVGTDTIIATTLALLAFMYGLVGALALFKKADITPESIKELGIAMLLVAASMVIFTGAGTLMQNVNWLNVGLGLLVMLAALTAMAVISKFLPGVSTSIMQFGSGIMQFGLGLLLAIAAMSLFIPQFSQIIATVSENLQPLIELIKNFIVSLLNAIQEIIPEIGQTIIVIIQTVCQVIRETMPDIAETLIVVIKSLLQVIRETLPDFIETVCVLITSLLTAIKDNIYQWTSLLIQIVVDMLHAIADNIGPLINAAIDLVLKTIKELGETFRRRAPEFIDTLIDFGVNLMKGLWNGIAEGLARLLENIPLIGDKIADGLRKTMDIHSPSRMTEEMGILLDEGLSKGMIEHAGETANKASSAMTEIISAISDTLNSDEIDNSLTITPVLDLSNVENGTRDISSMMSSISGKDISLSSSMATAAARENNYKNNKDSIGGNVTNNNSNDRYNVTFNVTTDDPEELARETDKLLQRSRLNAQLAKGGA